MRLNIIADTYWESRVDLVLNELSNCGFRKYFDTKEYGSGLHGVTIVFMCQDPALNLKRRLRHSKKESKLYMDIMLELPTMQIATPEARKREVAQRLFDEVPEVLARYKIPDFNKDAFVSDFRSWIDGIGWR